MSTPNNPDEPAVPQPDPVDPQTTPVGDPVTPAQTEPQPPAPDQPELITSSTAAAAVAAPRAQFDPPPDPRNTPMQLRTPLLPFTLYLFAARFDHARNFAAACLDPQQPWTFIEDAQMLRALMGVNVFQFSDALQHPDAEAILIALVDRYCTVVRHPDELAGMPQPPDHVTLTVSDVSGTDDGAVVTHTPADVSPMSLPTRG